MTLRDLDGDSELGRETGKSDRDGDKGKGVEMMNGQGWREHDGGGGGEISAEPSLEVC